MDVITSHIDSEFDSFASMVAAKKLYPRAHLVFAGSQEKSVRGYLRESAGSFDIQRLKSTDLEAIDRLIVVDTRRRDRIGPFAEVADRQGVEVHIYDHHPPSPKDLAGDVEVIEETGANITVMVELLRQRKVVVTPEEATLFAIALYEDTGSLTFGATTPRDLTAGAWLLEQGANLNVVAGRLRREFTPEQVMVLNDLIKGLRRFTVRGIEVAVATAATDHYIGDLAVIAHRLKEMENLNVLFVAARMGDRIHLVARSRIEAVDAGQVAYEMGGGGHPTAASATIHGGSLSSVAGRLRNILRRVIPEPLKARSIMTAPARTLPLAASLAEAREYQRRTGLHIFPVVSGKTFKGLIARPDIAKAIRHGFSKAPVSDYMNTEMETVTPGAAFGKIEEIIVGRGQRFLPVVERRQLQGIITRTDYLRALRREAARRPPFGYEYRLPRRSTRRRDLSEFIGERLPDGTKDLLHRIGREGDRQGVPVYLVGGAVRDLLLDEENIDLDIMVEGDGIAFAGRLGKVFGGRVNSYKRFETAVVVMPGGEKIDVATARAEYYASPGALPTVEHGTVKMDLFRRDFTINALALQLNADRFGTLHDFFGGQKDLEERKIRVLHNLSFVEDPTRVFRAIRFETRLRFQLGEVTRRLIKDAVTKDLLGHIMGRRLSAELSHILREKNPLPALARMEELGLLAYIHPGITVSRRVHRLFRGLKGILDDIAAADETRVALFLAALTENLDDAQREDFADRLALPPRRHEQLHHVVREGRAVQRLVEKNAGLPPGDLYVKLDGFAAEPVLYAWARTSRPGAGEALGTLITTSRHVRTALRGKDLMEMGYPPGPAYRMMLGALMKEKINGAPMGREEERAWLLDRFPPAGEEAEEGME